MLITNINLQNEDEIFQYVVEYIRTPLDETDVNFDLGYVRPIKISDDVILQDIVFCNGNEKVKTIKHLNHWYNIELGRSSETSNLVIHEYIPEKYNTSKIRIYFPNYSCDIYRKSSKYALTIGTWICNQYIILNSYILDRIDALACDGMKTFYDERYHEYIELPIVDPMDLIYSDDWSNWRKNICGEPENSDLINSVGSILYCTLYPIEDVESGYVKNNFCSGGQNSIRLTEQKTDFLNLTIKSNTNRSLLRNERPSIVCNIVFNKYYDADFEDYLKETYGLSECKVQYELVIGDKDNIYSMCRGSIIDPKTEYIFTKEDITEYNFENGDGWVPGISIKCSMNVLNEYDDTILTLISNELPLTEDLFRYFIKTDFVDSYGYTVNNVNLEDVDMKMYNINAVNKTENKVVKIDKPFENKQNIGQTMFYRVSDSYSIFIYPEVSENICINLDRYKHLVKSFILQIEGIKFVEIGRIQSGVIFKVIGNKLPKKQTSGQYYVLDQDTNVVTSGQYTYRT